MPATIDDGDFAMQLEAALKQSSDEAVRAMLARGRTVTYRERDTPPGHVIHERPDGTKETLRIDLADARSSNRPLTTSELDSIARDTAELDARLDVLFAARKPKSDYARRRQEAYAGV